MSSNPEYGEVYSIQHVIKSVSNLPHIDGFLWVLQVASTNKTDSHRHDIIEIIIESGAKHLNPAIWHFCDTKKDLIEDHPRNIPVIFAVH